MKLFIAASHDATYRNGGWAFVRTGGEVTGWAGGERRTRRARMALAGFAAALKDLPVGDTLAVVAARPDALVLHTLLKPPADPPAEDVDIRATLAKLLTGRAWTLAVGDPKGLPPLAFATAWSDLASEKAKMTGPFTNAIPRSNLAKVAGL